MTILLFSIRFFLLLSKPKKPLAGIQRMLPYLNDTMLLLAGLRLMRITHLIPFDNVNWLDIKILLLLVYIGLGMVMMKARSRSPKFFITCLLAMACVGSIMYLAMYRPF